MSLTPVIFPSGTLRQQYCSEQTSKAEAVLGAIAQISGDLYIDPTLVWTAKYLVGTEDCLDPEAQLGLTLVVFSLLVAITQGSTRMPIAPERGATSAANDLSFLDGLLSRFQHALENAAKYDQIADHAPSNAAKLRAAARELATVRSTDPCQLLTSQNLPTLLGRVDATMRGDTIPYRPLLLTDAAQGRALTTERMLRKEDTLAARFIERSRAASDTSAAELREAIQEVVAHPTYYAPDKAQTLNFEQAHAALLAVHAPLAFVTGGPGTGKTSIIVTVLRLLVRLGVAPDAIALAAPTGKAAYRMRESAIDQLSSLRATPDAFAPAQDLALKQNLPESRTLHRLLEYAPGRDIFRRNNENPVDAQVVICDEASMIDLDMMHALVEALGEDTRLILVGDADQLPPIGGGQPFRDLVGHTTEVDAPIKELIARLSRGASPTMSATHPMAAEGPGPANIMRRFTARLTHSYRMNAEDAGGKKILALAQAIHDTAPIDAYLQKTIPVDTLAHYLQNPVGVALIGDQDSQNPALEPFIKAWFEHFVALNNGRNNDDALRAPNPFNRTDDGFTLESSSAIQRVFEHHARARILCLTQIGRTGARAVNQALHKQFYEAHASEASKRLKNRPRFLHLEPVMLTQNNYDLNIFNGDIGMVANVSTDGKRPVKKVLFPRSEGGFRALSLNAIRAQLALCFATSVHKSQGSEFAHVALVLPTETMALLNRPLLYTAITRASKSVTLLDPAGLFAQGAATELVRYTGLPERLGVNG